MSGPYPTQGGYPPYGQPPPNNSDNALKIVLIVVAAVVLLCGGLFAAIFFVFFRTVETVTDSVGEAFDTTFEGSENRALGVTEGEEFTIRGFDYAAGWSFSSTPTDAVDGLEATNDRPEGESENVLVVFRLIEDNVVVGEVTCPPSADVPAGRAVVVGGCRGDTGVAFDEIEVYDDSVFE